MLPYLSKNIFNPHFLVEYYDGFWIDASAVVHDAPIEASVPPDFGAAAAIQATISMYLAPDNWRGMPFRISIGFEDQTPIPCFVGTPTSFRRSAEGSSVLETAGRTVTTFQLAGITELIASQKFWSPLFVNKPAATKTAFDSNDDPSAPDYDAGIINWILWQCGGRPVEQEPDYPGAIFYYRCDHGPLAPEYYWLAGENSMGEIERLCNGNGGRFYQDAYGVAVYESPYRLSTEPKFNYTDTMLTYAERVDQNAGFYDSLEESADQEQTVTKVICQYTDRYIAASQIVFEKNYDYNLFGDKNFTLETQAPFFGTPTITVEAGVIRSGRLAGAADITVTILESSASRLVINVANELAEPIMIYTIRVAAQPLVVGEQGSAEYGTSNANVLEVPDNPCIQSEEHAYRLCRMLHDYYSQRSLIAIKGAVVNPELSVGDYITLQYSAFNWQIQEPTLCQILNMSIPSDGFMDLIVRKEGYVPQKDEFFVIGHFYTTEERMLGY